MADKHKQDESNESNEPNEPNQPNQYIIRPEQPSDYEHIAQLHFKAFGGQEEEAKIVENTRTSKSYLPELSLVATDKEARIIGHALFSLGEVADRQSRHKVLVLGPIAVAADLQKQGIGGALIREGLRIAEQIGYSHVFVVGHPSYYPKFEFEPARALGFDLKQFEVSDEVFMVHVVRSNAQMPGAPIQGELFYPQAFLA